MCLKIVSFLFLLCSCAYSSAYQGAFAAAEGSLLRARMSGLPLVKTFCRVITLGADELHHTTPHNRLAFLHSHYARRWSTVLGEVPNKQTSSTTSDRLKTINKLGKIEGMDDIPPLEDFHAQLAARFEQTLLVDGEGVKRLKKPHPSLTYPIKLGGKDKLTFQEKLCFRPNDRPFVNGHEVLLDKWQLEFPIMAVTFFDQEEAAKKVRTLSNAGSGSSKKVCNWFAPLEQALIMSHKRQYLNNLAILNGAQPNGWGDYNRFALALIPVGTVITGSYGLVAHQGPGGGRK